MKITVYQIIPELDNIHLMFRDFRQLQIACGGECPAEYYEAVYAGEVDAATLEDVYAIFNNEHPKDFQGRSLSVSDIIEVHFSPEKSKFYYCNSGGFLRIEFNKERAMLKISNHDYQQCEIIRCGTFSIVFCGTRGIQTAHCSKAVLTRGKFSQSQLGYQIQFQYWGDDHWHKMDFLLRPKILYVESGIKGIPDSIFYEQQSNGMRKSRYGMFDEKNFRLAEEWCSKNGYKFAYLL